MQVALGLVQYGQANQTLKYDTFEPYLHVDNPTNARVVLSNGQSVGPYTLNAVISTPSSQGSFTVDTSDTSYPNVGIFSNAPINMYLTSDETPNPGISYAPIANISSTITVSGNVNATVTNIINATITNASIPVTQSGTWNVNITNATIPVSGSVSITSGSVTISNASIAVINASGTKITSARPPKILGSVADSPNPNTVNMVLDTDVQGLVIEFPEPLSQYVHFKIAWHPVSGPAVAWVPLELFQFSQNVYVIPITPSTFDSAGNITNSIDVTLQGTVAANQAALVTELFEPNPLWLEFFAPPFAEPNQSPFHNELTLVSGVAQWILPPTANIQINIFEVIMEYLTNGASGDQWYVAHGSVLPGAGIFPANSQILATGGDTTGFNATSFAVHPLHGAPLPRGHGIFAECTLAGALNMGVTLNFSLS